MKKKTLLRIVSYLLTIAIVMTSSSITSFAESLDDVSANEIVKEATETAEEIATVSENEGEEPADISGDDEEIVIPGEEETTPGEEIIPEEEEIPDVSDNDEIIEDVSGNENINYDATVTGKAEFKIGSKKYTCSGNDILTFLAGSTFTDAKAVTITLKSDITTTGPVEIKGKNVTLDIGKYNFTCTGTEYNIATIKVTDAGTTLTIKGTTGKIVSTNSSWDTDLIYDGAVNIKAGKVIVQSGTIEGKSLGVIIHSSEADAVPSLQVKGGKIIGEDAIVLYSKSNVEVTGGTISSSHSYGHGIYMVNTSDDSVVRIKGGKIEARTGISLYSNSEVEITGGTINSTFDSLYIERENSIVRMKGGTLSTKNLEGNAYGIMLEKGKLYLSGGTINADGRFACGVLVGNKDSVYDNKSSLYITGGKINVSAPTYVGIGIQTAGKIKELVQTGGTVTVKAKDAYGMRFTEGSTSNITHYISGGSYNVSSTDDEATGLYVDDAGVEFSGSAKVTVDGKKTIGACLPKGSLVLKGGEFVLGSAEKDSADEEVYGVIATGGKLSFYTGKITISSSAKTIYGVISNEKQKLEKLTLSINATNADEVYGVAFYRVGSGTSSFILPASSKLGSDLSLSVENSNITITGNIKKANGVYMGTMNTTSTSCVTGDNELKVRLSKINVSSSSSDAASINGICYYNKNLTDKGLFSAEIAGNDINVSAAKNARDSSDAPTSMNGVYFYGAYIKDVIVENNNITVTNGNVIDAKIGGVFIDKISFYDTANKTKIIVYSNRITVKSGKVAGAAVGCYTYWDNDSKSLGFDYSEIYSKNIINVLNSGKTAETDGIYSAGGKLLYEYNNISVSGPTYSTGIKTTNLQQEAVINNTTVNAKNMAPSSTDATGCYGVWFWSTGADKLLISDCNISATAKGNVPTTAVFFRDTSKIPDVEIDNSILTTSSSENDSWSGALYLMFVKDVTITNSTIASSNSGVVMKNFDGKVSLENTKVKSKNNCISLSYCTDQTVYVSPESIFECTGTDGVVNEGTSVAWNNLKGCSFVKKDGKEYSSPVFSEISYVKMVDAHPVKVSIKENYIEGAKLLSFNGSLEAVIDIPEGYEKTSTFHIWRKDGESDVIATSKTVTGKTFSSSTGSHTAELTVTVSYVPVGTTPGDNSKLITRTVTVAKEVTIHPEIILLANKPGDSDQSGAFADGSKEKTIVTKEATLTNIVIPENPEKSGYLFTCWHASNGYCQLNESYSNLWLSSGSKIYASYVPEGYYVKNTSTGEVITTLNKDGKSYQLPDEQYTGYAIKPTSYQLYYGLVPLSDIYTHTTYVPDETLVILGKGTTKTTYKNCTNVGEGTITIKSVSKKYKGTITLKFNIVPSKISNGNNDDKDADGLATYEYTGKEIKYTPILYNKEKKKAGENITLKKGRDFSITMITSDDGSKVSKIKNAGVYYVYYKGSKNYSYDTGRMKLTVTQAYTPISKATISVSDYAYDGNKCSGNVSVTYGATTLVSGKDYRLMYRTKGKGTFTNSAPTEVGTYEVQIIGFHIGGSGYIGTVTKVFKITGVDISKWSINFTDDVSKLSYDTLTKFGEAFAFSGFKDKNGTSYNKEDVTYSVSYAMGKKTYSSGDEIQAGKVTISVKGTGKYYGTIKKTVTVKALNIATASKVVGTKYTEGKVSVYTDNGFSAEYSSKGAELDFDLQYGYGDSNTTRLLHSSDYKVSYKNNKKLGKASMTIKGKGNLTGSITVSFDVVPASLGDNNTGAYVTDRAPSKKAGDYTTSVSVCTIGEQEIVLKSGTDYTLTYMDDKGTILDKKSKIKAGQTITVVATGKGNYTGSITCTFDVYKASISGMTAKVKDQRIQEIGAAWYNYRGQPYANTYVRITSSDITVSDKTYGALVYGRDYVITGYSNNTTVGTAYVTIQGIGDYTGTKKVAFKIKQSDITKKATKY